MRRAAALLLVAALAAGTAFLLAGPPAWACAAAVLAVAALRAGRRGYVALAAGTVALNALVVALFAPGADPVPLGRFAIGPAGAVEGAIGGARLSAVVGLNLAAFSWVPPARLLEGLGLGRRATGLLAAVLLAAQDLGRDHERLVLAARLDGAWPQRRRARLGAHAALLPPLMVAALGRAQARRDALRLAGVATGRRFVPVVAVAGLAVAARMALLAIPNDPLTYAAVFLGGVAFGAVAAALGAIVAMALTDLFLSGLAPQAFANAPAMALVGLLGGWFRAGGLLDPAHARAARLWAAVAGVAATAAFSVVADAGEWMLSPELRASGALGGRILGGLAFNVLPAAANAAVFTAAAVPVAEAFRAAAGAPTGGRPR